MSPGPNIFDNGPPKITGTDAPNIDQSDTTVDLDSLSEGDEDEDEDEGPEEPFRIGEIHMETNNATHIQQFVLALVDAGFQVHVEAQEDGFWVRVFWDSKVVEEGNGA